MKLIVNIEKKHFYILLALVLTSAIIGYAIADGWDLSKPFHSPLYANEITSATEGAGPDAQPVVVNDNLKVTGNLSVQRRVDSWYMSALSSSFACKAINPTVDWVMAKGNFDKTLQPEWTTGSTIGDDICFVNDIQLDCLNVIKVTTPPAENGFYIQELYCNGTHEFNSWAGPLWDPTLNNVYMACCKVS
jgi:hypothetical protein